MAAYGYHKENDQVVVQQLHELFGDKLHLDIIENVAKSCQFDVYQSSHELLEIANSNHVKHTPSSYKQMNSSPDHNNSKKSKKSLEIDRVIREINDGYKVLILLRGLPGSGKSTLAKSILYNTIGFDSDIAIRHILSTDDFFMKNGVYQHDANKLHEAHGWNHQRTFNVMSKGYSPIIIDNTNTQMWEMKPYAMMATDYGYYLEVLEPDTHWCFNDKELEKRNKHGVPRGTIKNMLERYQKNVTPMKLLTAYDCKYKLQKPPQYRLHPPLSQISVHQSTVIKPTIEKSTSNFKILPPPQSVLCTRQDNSKESINFMDFYEATVNKKVPNSFDTKTIQSSSVDDILMHEDSTILKTPVLQPEHTTKIKQSSSLFDSIHAWGVDETALRSWDIVTPITESRNDHHMSSTIVIDDDDEIIEMNNVSTTTDDEDFYMLRNILIVPPPSTVKVLHTCSRDINRDNHVQPQGIRKKIMIDKSCLTEDFLEDHSVNLENLGRVFPNIAQNIIKYWYKKCNCDFDCTIELLLTERDEIINVVIDDDFKEPDKEIDNAEPISVDSDSGSSVNETPALSPNAKHKRKTNNSSSDESQDLKKYIESRVTISNDHYSEKLLKIKESRFAESSSSNAASQAESSKTIDYSVVIDDEWEHVEWEQISSKGDSADNTAAEHVDNVETMEFNLGDHFVKQLEDTFGDPNLLYPKGFQPVVQMPVAFARQLYTFYIESVYQQMEVQNCIMDALVKEDEEFARKLQEDEEKGKTTNSEPSQIPDIVREQRELSKWQQEVDKWKEDTPDTLAARLTRDKLFNSFPSVDRNTLVELLHAHDNVYKDTVETLLLNTNHRNINGDIETIKDPPINTAVVKEMWDAHESCKDNEAGQDAACSAINYREEATRCLEKRTNLYEKAQKYYQSGMKEVALFYSSLATKQTRLYEQANSLAATAFLDEHSKRLEDFNTLDLHFLYVKEAIPNLDIFLDRNINLLRLSTSKSAECLQIITGRGRNSKNGIARIKPAVIDRLKKRNISYQQLNPGLLRVMVTKSSKVTSEL